MMIIASLGSIRGRTIIRGVEIVITMEIQLQARTKCARAVKQLRLTKNVACALLSTKEVPHSSSNQ